MHAHQKALSFHVMFIVRVQQKRFTKALTYMDLLGEFSGGGENEDNWSVSTLKFWLVGSVDDGRDEETHRLSGTGLSDGHQVIAGHGDWPALQKKRFKKPFSIDLAGR